MEKYPVTFAYVVAVAAAFLGEFGSRALDAMSGLIINWGWCGANGASCLFFYQLALLLICLGIVIAVDKSVLQQRNWTKVSFSEWFPVDGDVIGGIIVHNETIVDLKDCEVDIVGFDDDLMNASGFANNMVEFFDLMKKEGTFPSRLFWYEGKNNPKAIVNIGRGKEGYIMLVFAVDDKTKVMGRKPTYQIRTDRLAHVEPFMKGWLYLRLSARVNDVPLPLMNIAVRLEVENETPVIKQILKGKAKAA
jgi:hypothetical protein